MFRDLNKNGRLDPYEDPDQPVEARVADLLARLEKEVKEKKIRQVSTASAGLADSGAKYGE